jgi:hypothetical protein
MKTRIMYIENKETGEARIGRVAFSRTYNTVYYQSLVLQRAGSEKIKGNFFNAKTGEEYWVSGCKKRGGDAHWAERVPVTIDEDVAEEYWTQIRGMVIKEE